MIRIDAETDWARVLIRLVNRSNLSHAQISRATGIRGNQIGDWLAGRIKPDHKSLVKLLPALGCQLAIVRLEDS